MEKVPKKVLMRWFRYILLFLGCYVLFFLMVFNYQDLETEITKVASQQGAYLQFNDLSLGLFPTPSVQLKDLVVTLRQTPEIQMDEVVARPHIPSFLAFKQGVSTDIKGFLGANIEAQLKQTGVTEDNQPLFAFEADVSGLNIEEALSTFAPTLRLPLIASGQINAVLKGSSPQQMDRNTESEFSLTSNNVNLKNIVLDTPLGPLQMPDVKLSQLNLVGRLVNQELIIEESRIGGDGDLVRARIKGQVPVDFGRRGPQLAGYNLKVEVRLSSQGVNEIKARVGDVFGLLQPSQTAGGSAPTYTLNLQSSSMYRPPRINKTTF